MPYRIFEDSSGTEWQVWDIVPRLSDRRGEGNTDRRVEVRPIPFADRRREQRRVAQATLRRASLRGTYAQGWLCFESAYEKRRLSPIPGDWITCDEEQLEHYARRGERVAPSQNYGFHGEDDRLAEAG